MAVAVAVAVAVVLVLVLVILAQQHPLNSRDYHQSVKKAVEEEAVSHPPC